MKRVSVLVALVSLVALDASAGDCGKTSLGMSFNEPVRFADRHDLRDVDYGISTTNRKVDLLLTANWTASSGSSTTATRTHSAGSSRPRSCRACARC